ncbi:hypothetical protein [Stenoxybacter acetivorans]|uniref:hypothetical protein n=1 Tax=Stenoxybacter acetivorans TaxID=422441 RepID=UPI00068C0DF1|nr:hypothetical protein [Stenoxybacter acetivorans]
MIKPSGNFVITIAVYLCVLAAGCVLGYTLSKQHYTTQIAELERDYAQGNVALQAAYAEALQQAQTEKQKWFNFAQKQGVQLAQTAQELDDTREQVKKDITHAIEQDQLANHRDDGECFGDHGLRLYNRALYGSETD